MNDYQILAWIIVAASLVLWFLARYDDYKQIRQGGVKVKEKMSDLHWGVVTTDGFGYLHAAFTLRYDAEKWLDEQKPDDYKLVHL